MSTELRFKLHPKQLEIYKSKARFKVVAAGRRSGKSYYSCCELLLHGLMDKNSEGTNILDKDIYYVAPTFEQGKRIMWEMLKRMGKGVIKSTLENTCIVTLLNGRRIHVKGSDRPDTLRGVGLSFVVLDEYANMKPSVWEVVLRPALADVKGEALFIGTPNGKNHFYDLYLQCRVEDDWEGFEFTSVENPTLAREEIEAARKIMSAHAFRQEFEASFSSAGTGEFKEDWLNIIDYTPEECNEGFWFVAVDPAGYSDVAQATNSKLKRLDETAIAMVNVSPNGWHIDDIRAGRWGVRETSLQIIRAAQSVRAATVGVEKGSLKAAVMPYLEDQMRRLNSFPHIMAVTHGGQNKIERIVWALQGRFQNGRITLRKREYLKKFIDQYLDFPNTLAHDDMLDALAYIDQIAKTSYVSNADTEDWHPLDEIAGY